MSNIMLTIGGREFKVACAPGEEDHVTGLGRMIDSKIADMNMAGQSEARMLLFAALLLADELHEAKYRGGAAAPVSPQNDDLLADRLERVAQMLEKCASHLEGVSDAA